MSLVHDKSAFYKTFEFTAEKYDDGKKRKSYASLIPKNLGMNHNLLRSMESEALSKEQLLFFYEQFEIIRQTPLTTVDTLSDIAHRVKSVLCCSKGISKVQLKGYAESSIQAIRARLTTFVDSFNLDAPFNIIMQAIDQSTPERNFWKSDQYREYMKNDPGYNTYISNRQNS